MRSETSLKKKRRFLSVFEGTSVSPPPVWLMRQAGRYLPEYRETRKQAGSFLKLCYSPNLATEVTLQPIRRFGFDAAILFSDILVVPDALGQRVEFVEGEGPRLDPISERSELAKLEADGVGKTYDIVCETVARLRQDLPVETALIGFCGAPWTVATYMVGGRGSGDQAAARLFAYRDPDGFSELIDILTDTSIEYLSQQVSAGADVVQIFDSWAGSLPEDQFERWVVAPTARIVRELRKRHPELPVMGFPRGAGGRLTVNFARETGVDGVSCDTSVPLAFMAGELSDADVVVQGNLDPLLLVAGGMQMETRVREILHALNGKRFVFNLGHGIVPQTPPENVARLVELVRGAA